MRKRHAVVGGALLVSLVLGAAALASPRAASLVPTVQTTIPPSAAWPNDFVVRPGDRVVGIGRLVAREGEATRLCTGLEGILDVVGYQYRCSALSVEVRGVDFFSLVGSHPLAGARYVDGVVHGVWDGQVLAVNVVGGARPSIPASTPLACELNVPGAAGAGALAGTEDDHRRLQSIVDGNPEKFGGLWLAVGPPQTIVVATTGDLSDVSAALAGQFPFPFCLVRVRFSTADLTRAADEIVALSGQTWWRDIDPQRNKVLVRVPVLTKAAIDAVAAEPAAELVPLLMAEP